MKKALSYRLFGLGRIPRKWRPLLEQEGILVAGEGMPGWFVAKDVKGPGKRYRRRAEGFSGCLVITNQRVLCFTDWKRQINIATQDPSLSALQVAVPKANSLSISFESAAFRTGWQGMLEFRFKTKSAEAFHQALKTLGAQDTSRAEGSSV